MADAFRSPALLAPCRLSPESPLGLFKPLGRSDASELMWIVERDGQRFAVFIAGDIRWRFEAFLADESDSWSGLHLGQVEILVDSNRAVFQDSMRVPLGCLTLAEGLVRLGARLDRGGGAVRFDVGVCAAPSGLGSVVMPRWSLIQRDHLGGPVPLFEHDASS